MSDLHPQQEGHPQTMTRAARGGRVLFCLYLVLFAGFLLLNVFAPRLMADYPVRDPYFEFPGINLALCYGLALIFAAVFLVILQVRFTKPRRTP